MTITKYDDVISLEEVTERFDEIKDTMTLPHFKAGWNVAGGEMDAIAEEFETAEEAKEALVEYIEGLQDKIEELDPEQFKELAELVFQIEISGETFVIQGPEQRFYWVIFDKTDGLDDEDRDELAMLQAFLDQCTGNGGDHQWQGDWLPSHAIRDSYFTDYAQKLADDIGAIPKGVTWPMTCIDWDMAARELQMDYTSVEFDDITYWVR